jgi:hypothetical protein
VKRREFTPDGSVIPAQAGIQRERRTFWIPACAGMTKPCHSERSEESTVPLM